MEDCMNSPPVSNLKKRIGEFKCSEDEVGLSNWPIVERKQPVGDTSNRLLGMAELQRGGYLMATALTSL